MTSYREAAPSRSTSPSAKTEGTFSEIIMEEETHQDIQFVMLQQELPRVHREIDTQDAEHPRMTDFQEAAFRSTWRVPRQQEEDLPPIPSSSKGEGKAEEPRRNQGPRKLIQQHTITIRWPICP